MSNHFMVKIFITFLVLSSVTYSQRVWQKYANNPVVPTWSGAVDDPNGYKYATEPGVLYDTTSKIYRMWFSSLTYGYGPKLNISEAVSLNGIDWYTYAKNPVLPRGPDGAYDENVRGPKVIKDDSGYKMYYSGVTNDYFYRIGLATSTDGITWTKYPSNPVLTVGTTGAWDDLNVGFCSVDYDTNRSLSSRYMMWYFGGDVSVTAIGLATSSDGITWTKYPGNPVYTRSIDGWDNGFVLGPSVVHVDGYYHMFYQSAKLGANCCVNAIGWAYSTDGISWTRGDTLPVMTMGTGWESSITNIDVKFIDNKFHMWYSGYSPGTGWQIGYATSVYEPLGVTPPLQLPQTIRLYESYPNPFNPQAVIEYDIPKGTSVTLKIVNTLGQEVATLVNEYQPAGHHKVIWDASKYTSVSSGAYFYQMLAGGIVQTKKMMLMK